MRYCTKCGSELVEGATFCTKCGSSINGEVNSNVAQTINYNYNYNYNNGPISLGIKKRDIAIAIILSFLTCGIYMVYWYIVMTDDINRASGDSTTSCGMSFLFSLLTCGIYTIYWYYKKAKQLYEAGRKHGIEVSDNAVLYLILGIFGFGIVNYALIQSDLNKFAN